LDPLDVLGSCRYATKHNIATKPTFRLLSHLCEEQRSQAPATDTVSMQNEAELWDALSVFLDSQNAASEAFDELHDVITNSSSFHCFENLNLNVLTKKRSREKEYNDGCSTTKCRRW
jgi:hypothetical protein